MSGGKFVPYKAPKGQENLIPVVFGDWSNDGHGEAERVYVWSNKGIAEWRAAFASGCRKTKVNLPDAVAADYGDRSISAAALAALRATGLHITPEGETPDGAVIHLGEFEEMFFHLVRVGDPSITFKRLKNGPHHMEVHPGGYGLFGEGD